MVVVTVVVGNCIFCVIVVTDVADVDAVVNVVFGVVGVVVASAGVVGCGGVVVVIDFVYHGVVADCDVDCRVVVDC